jgi:hypothetical protein
MTRIARLTLSFAAITFLSTSSADAGSLTIYNSALSWAAAASGSTITEDFSSAALDTSGPLFDRVINLCDGFGIRSSIQGGTLLGEMYRDSVNWGVGFGGSEDAPLFEFANGTGAFGADWDLGTLYGGLTMRVGFVDGSVATAVIAGAFAGSYNGFFGVVADDTIMSIRFSTAAFGSSAGQSFGIDNARMTTASGDSVQTPEPGTLALMSLGTAVAAMARRRKQQALKKRLD